MIKIGNDEIKKIFFKNDPIKKVYQGTNLIYELNLFKPVFADNTWEQISQACKTNDPIINSWNVGDTKTATYDGRDIDIVIIGKKHDTYSDGTIAPLTFASKNIVPGASFNYNDSGSSEGSWKGSNLRSSIESIRTNFNFGSLVKPVKKHTGTGGSSRTGTIETSDYLFAFAESEIFSQSEAGYSNRGFSYMDECALCTQYEYYKNNAPSFLAFLRSPDQGNKKYVCAVKNGSFAIVNPYYPNNIFIGFCL